jgi:DNA-binding transcriptional MerR regulator
LVTVDDELTIDQLAAACDTTSRNIRAFQTLGLMDHPDLRGRTGLYGASHRQQLGAILRLQSDGFSLASIQVLFDAQRHGRSLSDVIGTSVPQHRPAADATELYGFAELQRPHGRTPPFLSVVPTTMWLDTAAS